jgi:hypothetical protein
MPMADLRKAVEETQREIVDCDRTLIPFRDRALLAGGTGQEQGPPQRSERRVVTSDNILPLTNLQREVARFTEWVLPQLATSGSLMCNLLGQRVKESDG